MYEFFDSIAKPPLTPPAITYPIAWSILYPLIFITYGYTTYKIYSSKFSNTEDLLLIGLMLTNLMLNFSYTPIFSGMRAYGWGSLISVLLVITAAAIAVLMYRHSPVLSYLQLPYIFWLIFASYLSIGIAFLN
jgi:tryptophan-rich sensory protein